MADILLEVQDSNHVNKVKYDNKMVSLIDLIKKAIKSRISSDNVDLKINDNN